MQFWRIWIWSISASLCFGFLLDSIHLLSGIQTPVNPWLFAYLERLPVSCQHACPLIAVSLSAKPTLTVPPAKSSASKNTHKKLANTHPLSPCSPFICRHLSCDTVSAWLNWDAVYQSSFFSIIQSPFAP